MSSVFYVPENASQMIFDDQRIVKGFGSPNEDDGYA